MKPLALAFLTAALALLVGWLVWPDPEAPSPTAGPARSRAPLAGEQLAARDRPAETAASGRERVEASAPVLAPPPVAARPLGGYDGRVVETDGRPVPHVTVTLFELGGALTLRSFTEALPGGRPPRLDVATARTDSEGRFRLLGAYPRDLHAIGIDLGGQRGFLALVEELPPAEGTRTLGDVVLPAHARVRGRVVDANGRPAAGMRVRAGALLKQIAELDLEDARATSVFSRGRGHRRELFELPWWAARWIDRLPIPTTRTDARGEFELVAVPAGDATLVVDGPARPSKTVSLGTLARGGDRELERIVLDPAATIQGVVQDSAGAPVARVEMFAGQDEAEGGSWFRYPALHPVGRSDSSGRFTARGLRTDMTRIVAARRSRADPWTVVEVSSSEPLVVTLPELGRLVVAVVDAGGRPIADARLSVQPASPIGSGGERVWMDPPRPTTARPDGRGRQVVDGLARGEYGVLAQAPGHGSTWEHVELDDAQVVVELALAPAHPTDVIVSTPQGEPVARARVGVFLGKIEAPAADTAWTDEAGRARLELTPFALSDRMTGIWLRVDHPAYATARTKLVRGARPQEVRLTTGGTLGITPPGAAAGGGGWLVSLARRGNTPSEDSLPILARVDAGARSEIELLSPGEYRWALIRRLPSRDLSALLGNEVDDDPVARGTTTIVEGRTVELVIEVPEGG